MPRIRKEQPPYSLGLRCLEEHPDGLSALALAEKIGIAKRNMLEYIRLWRAEKKVVIIEWEQQRGKPGDPTPIYGLSSRPNQKDKPKPRPLSDREKQARYRQNNGVVIRARRRKARTGDPNHFLTLIGRTK